MNINVIIFFNFLQFRKQSLPIFITEEGIDICSSEEHPSKTPIPIDINEDGDSKETFVNDEQPWNIYDPVSITEEGMVISTNDEQSAKREPSILVKDEEIVIFLSEMQLEKVLLPISVTEDGMIISFKDEHLLKTFRAIFVTDEGI